MKVIKTSNNIDDIKKKLKLVIDDKSNYSLIENGMKAVDNCINIYFDSNNLEKAYELIMQSGYYNNNSEYLLGKINDNIHMVEISKIIYIEGINNDTYIYTNNGHYLIKEKLYELEALLYDKKFVRIAKAYIVNIKHINHIKPTFNGKLIIKLSNNLALEVSRHYLQKFKKYLGF